MDKFRNNLIKKVLSKEKETPVLKKILDEYRVHDEICVEVDTKFQGRKVVAPSTIVDKADEEKHCIEKRLEESDRKLNDLIQLGNELVTNVKVANEKREILRRNFEAVKRNELLQDLENESVEAMARFGIITGQWTELKAIKEPMGLYESLEDQKERIAELMKQKDDIIKQCQDEIKRVDQKYYEDLEKQSTDLSGLVERIDYQIELMMRAYNDHLELLQKTIEEERENLALKASRKWEELYEKRAKDEDTKMEIEREKTKFYEEEIDRIALEHEEITRATRIRLEKDAEKLQLELRNVKNSVLLNSEKLDYNYQVLQKRDDENVIIRNQQKHRVTKLNDTIAMLKQKIKQTKATTNVEVKKLSKEVLTLHSNIIEIEAKTNNFTLMNDKKYQTVWNIHYQEVTELLNRVLNIDRILHEQQLGLNWVRPDVLKIKLTDLPSFKMISRHLKRSQSPWMSDKKTSQTAVGLMSKQIQVIERTDEQKLADTRLLRNVLRKISDRAGFLLEEKLLNILEPYSEEEKTLVRLDNIFTALDIRAGDDIEALVEYFVPYSWCPNCSKGIPPHILDKLYKSQFSGAGEVASKLSNTKVSRMGVSGVSFTKEVSKEGSSKSKHLEDDESHSTTTESESADEIDAVLDPRIKVEKVEEEKKTVAFQHSAPKIQTLCQNHYLVIEPVLVLTALREFTEQQTCKNVFKSGYGGGKGDAPNRKDMTLSRRMSKEDVVTFWSQFSTALPNPKQKLWKSLEHGLNHYLKVLKEREALDAECEFLRKQNSELRHLLQKHLPMNE